VVITGPYRLVLIDSSGVPTGRGGGPPITVDLKEGRFTSPVAADGVVAVIELTRNRLLTFGIDGLAPATRGAADPFSPSLFWPTPTLRWF
jgi:hypothetical protein